MAKNDANPSGDARKPGRRLLPKPGQLIVRMYRQGLGDCFLLAFGTSKKNAPRYVLIDCGVHSRQTHGPKRLLQVMNHLCDATGNHFHIVVATHEHADHLSGFVQKGSPFLKDEVTIGEVWLAWTEQRGNRQADRLRKKRGTAKRVIDKAIEQAREKANDGAAVGAAPLAKSLTGLTDFERPPEDSVDLEDIQKRIRTLLAGRPIATNVVRPFLEQSQPLGATALGVDQQAHKGPSSNELALALLALKSGGNVTYCDPTEAQGLRVPNVSGVRAYVLGPPRDEKLLKKDLPSKVRGQDGDGHEGKFKEVYLSGSASTLALQLSPGLGDADSDEPTRIHDDFRYPFGATYRRTYRDDGRTFLWSKQFGEVPEGTQSFYESKYLGDVAWRRIDTDWLQATERLALNLDSDTNNTSLVLAFEWGEPGSGQVLLFPGDAQVGNWLSWRDHTYKAGNKTVHVDDLLKRTVLYKVGHHASHNATVKCDPRETTEKHTDGVPFGLELMEDIIALIPVDRDAAEKKMPTPWEMPHRPLYIRLREKAHRRVLRSDLSVAPLDNKEDQIDLRPHSPEWSAVPGRRGIKWRRSAEEFTDGTDGPLYYDILFPEPGDE